MVLLLLLLSAALAGDREPPTWPEGARLEVGEDEALYDHPPTTTEDYLRAESQVQLHLRWPAAVDDRGVVAYRILRAEVEAARVDGDALTWSALVDAGSPEWSVVPVDRHGNEGAPLVGRLVRLPVSGASSGMSLSSSLSAGSPPAAPVSARTVSLPEVHTAPRVIRGPRISYPPALAEDQIHGSVQVVLTIRASGQVQSARVVGGLHPDADAACVDALRDSRWRPGLVDGEAVSVSGVPYTCRFELVD